MPDFNIKYFTLKISNPLNHKKQARSLITKIIFEENKKISYVEINFIFCDDKHLLELNQSYLKKQTLTDVLAFDYSEENSIKGDIFISYERVKENAIKFKQKTQTELLRVMVHGVLHLLGYKDKAENDKNLMNQKEDHYLALYKTIK